MNSPRTALVIEDDDDIRRLLEIVLTQAGFAVTSVATGAAGLASAAEGGPFELVTVDVGLPDVDGTEIVRSLRAGSTASAGARIAMISARSSAADQSKGLNAGADAYLTKPFRPAKLRAAIIALMDGIEPTD